MMPLAHAVLHDKPMCFPLPNLIAMMQYKSLIIVLKQ